MAEPILAEGRTIGTAQKPMTTLEIPARAENKPGAPERHEFPVLALLDLLLGDFHRARLNYCYWKSRLRVAAVLMGDADLDLLVDRADLQRAQAMLLDRDFKLLSPVGARQQTGALSWLGYDPPSGRLVHVHLHFRLLLGEPLLKNYQVPWEAVLLSRAVLHPQLPVRILDSTSEALLLIVRAGLELRSMDPVLLRQRKVVADKFARDRLALAARVDKAALHELACELLNPRLADMIVQAMFDEPLLAPAARLRRAIKRELAPYRTYNALEARLRGLARAVVWAAGGLNSRFWHLPRPFNRGALAGGRVVAVLGVDGSGKSTVVKELRHWLGSELELLPIYFGTGGGRPSLLMRPFKLLLPLLTPMISVKPKGASHGKIGEHAPGVIYRLMFMIWAAIVAWEKRLKLLAARRGANRGLIILTDRYPQNQIIGFNDGPLLGRIAGVPRLLRQLEGAAYSLADRLAPDLVVKLEVRVETARSREPDMDSGVMRERIAAVPLLKFAGARVVSVNAEQPLPAVISAIKQEIWRLL